MTKEPPRDIPPETSVFVVLKFPLPNNLKAESSVELTTRAPSTFTLTEPLNESAFAAATFRTVKEAGFTSVTANSMTFWLFGSVRVVATFDPLMPME
jgi:hypothetical protein